MNNKAIVAIIILLTVGVFAWLADYGWKHRYGSPETYETVEPNLLTVQYRPEKLPLEPESVFAEVWRSVPAVELGLIRQMTEKPWPEGLIEAVNVQAFHDGSDIYFRLRWQDDHADASVAVDAFPDGCAMATPVDPDAPVRSIMMGFSSLVNIWHWRADKDAQFWQTKKPEPGPDVDFRYPFEQQEIFPVSIPKLESAVSDLLAQRAGSLTPKEAQIVHGRGVWRDGAWQVVLKRTLTTQNSEQDCQFTCGEHSVSFAVWDGDQQNRGSRKSMSEWVTLQIEQPDAQPREAGKGDRHLSEKEGKRGQAPFGERTLPKGASVAGILPARLEGVSPSVRGPEALDTRGRDARDTGTSWRKDVAQRSQSRLSLLASAYAGASEGRQAEPETEPRVITILAKRFVYTPSRITVQKGELITIRLESLDVTHGLYMDGYGIDIKARPGLIGKATFVADKSGRFTFRCSETCGEFHPYMVGFMEVTPNSRFGLFATVMGASFVVLLGIVFKGGLRNKGVVENVRTDQ